MYNNKVVDNRIGNESASGIADLIKCNTALTKINLRINIFLIL